MEKPFPAYRGSEEFVFVCYAHIDAEQVYSEIERLHSDHINVWYDEGIRPGAEWTDELARAIATCHKFLFFVTPRSVDSRHCRDEVQYALKQNKAIVVVYLEEAQLPPGLDLILGSIQAVHRTDHDIDRYHQKLLDTINDAIDEIDFPKSAPGETSTTQTIPVAIDNGAFSRQKIPGWLSGALIISMLLIAAYFMRQSPSDSIDRELAKLDLNSVAILPFEDRGGFEAGTYYPDSIAEDLLNRLAAIEQLKVSSRRSSFAYRPENPTPVDLIEVALALGVRNLLSGYIIRTGDTFRLTIELIDISTGREVVKWSDSYSRPIAQMLKTQTEIADSIASVFLPQGLSAQTQRLQAAQSTSSNAAFEYYLQARQILRHPVIQDVTLEKAAGLFSRAIDLDPDYAWARSGLCSTYTLAYRRGGQFAPAQKACDDLTDIQVDIFDVRLALGEYYIETGNLEDADRQLQIANRLMSSSAEAKIALAKMYSQRFAQTQKALDQVKAQEAYLAAIAAEPEYWYTYHAYAGYFSKQNKLQDALQQLDIAAKLEPTSIPTRNNIANTYHRMGQLEEAEKNWNLSIEMNPNNRWAHSGLSVLFHYQKNFPAAIRHLEAAVKISPTDHTLWGRLGESYRLTPSGSQRAETVFRKAIALAETDLSVNPNNWRTRGYLAIYYAYIDEPGVAQSHLAAMFKLNPGKEPMTHYWAGLIAYERGDIEMTFTELDLALAQGFSQQKGFIEDEPALEALRKTYPDRYASMLERY